MLARIVLRDDEVAGLTPVETAALEYELRMELSEIARRRGNGDSALILAVQAMRALDVLLTEIPDEETALALADSVRATPLGALAVERITAVAALTYHAA